MLLALVAGVLVTGVASNLRAWTNPFKRTVQKHEETSKVKSLKKAISGINKNIAEYKVDIAKTETKMAGYWTKVAAAKAEKEKSKFKTRIEDAKKDIKSYYDKVNRKKKDLAKKEKELETELDKIRMELK